MTDTTDRTPDFETLNAYVDGELSAAEAADVAQLVARDPAVAKQVAVLSRLRSAVRDSIETPDLVVPPVPAKATAPRKWLVAACVALLLIGGGAVLDRVLEPASGEAWLTPLVQLHNGWTAAADDRTDGVVVPAGLDAALARAYVPDLSAAKLTLAYGKETPGIGGNDALVLGYTGTRGCRVTLVITPPSGRFDETLRRFDHAGLGLFGWRAGDLDYLIVADGMDAGRFKLIAETVRRASIQHRAIDGETRMALAESRDSAAPCVA